MKTWKNMHPKEQSAIIMLFLISLISFCAFGAIRELGGEMWVAVYAGVSTMTVLFATIYERLKYAAFIRKCPPVGKKR